MIGDKYKSLDSRFGLLIKIIFETASLPYLNNNLKSDTRF